MADIESVRLPDNSTFNIKDPTALHGTDGINALADVSASSPNDSDLMIYNGSTSKWTAQANPFSNENLLINPFFTVNQRGATTITSGSGADGWKLEGGTSATFGTNQVTLTGALVSQWRENQLPNGTYTASVELLDGTIYSGTLTKTNDTDSLTFIHNSQIIVAYISSLKRFDLNTANVTGTPTTTVVYTKLEPGTVSTLANDIESDKTLETLKCQKADFSQIAYQNLDATTARKAYSAGQYFFNADGEYCRAKVAISSGQTLTEGTNFEKTTIAVEMAYSNIATGITGVTAHVCGNVVVLQIQKSFSESTAGWKSLGTLPAALTPKSAPLYFCGIDDSASSHANNHPINCSLAYSGEISAYIFSDKLNPSLKATVTYIR